MYVSMYVCMYSCTLVCVWPRTFAKAGAHVRIYVCMYLQQWQLLQIEHQHICICTYVHLYVCTHVDFAEWGNVCVCMYDVCRYVLSAGRQRLFPVEKMRTAHIEMIKPQQHVILPLSWQQSARKKSNKSRKKEKWRKSANGKCE